MIGGKIPPIITLQKDENTTQIYNSCNISNNISNMLRLSNVVCVSP